MPAATLRRIVEIEPHRECVALRKSAQGASPGFSADVPIGFDPVYHIIGGSGKSAKLTQSYQEGLSEIPECGALGSQTGALSAPRVAAMGDAVDQLLYLSLVRIGLRGCDTQRDVYDTELIAAEEEGHGRVLWRTEHEAVGSRGGVSIEIAPQSNFRRWMSIIMLPFTLRCELEHTSIVVKAHGRYFSLRRARSAATRSRPPSNSQATFLDSLNFTCWRQLFCNLAWADMTRPRIESSTLKVVDDATDVVAGVVNTAKGGADIHYELRDGHDIAERTEAELGCGHVDRSLPPQAEEGLRTWHSLGSTRKTVWTITSGALLAMTDWTVRKVRGERRPASRRPIERDKFAVEEDSSIVIRTQYDSALQRIGAPVACAERHEAPG
ncbi:hypothetical protein AURDEDRAFT_127549 [Auricularia subglabra TFB-10046 SS5]|nr:hypothetical protein AURDEDRAFT_127549 [Auricularia subglabra TFB-10046 SS5]